MRYHPNNPWTWNNTGTTRLPLSGWGDLDINKLVTSLEAKGLLVEFLWKNSMEVSSTTEDCWVQVNHVMGYELLYDKWDSPKDVFVEVRATLPPHTSCKEGALELCWRRLRIPEDKCRRFPESILLTFRD